MRQFLLCFSISILFVLVFKFLFAQERKIDSSSPHPVMLDSKTQHERRFVNSEKTEKANFINKQIVQKKQLQNDANTADVNDKKPKESTSLIPDNRVINLSLREQDIFQSHIVAKHFSSEKLNNIKSKNPDRINLIDFYFNKSFSIELIPGNNGEQKAIDDFVASFDPVQYESKRKESEKTDIEFPDAGVKIVLLPLNELPFEIQRYIKKADKTGCAGCKNGRAMPKNAGSINNKQ